MKPTIKIAIIDSGINNDSNYFNNITINGISICNINNKYEFIHGSYEDKCGHGTLCASVIKKESSNIEFFIVKIFDEYLNTNIQALEKALEYLLDIDVNIINMSISILQNKNLKHVKKLCNLLHKQDKIIVASVTNGKLQSKPSTFRSVIGVKNCILKYENSFCFSKYKRVNSVVDSLPYLHFKGNGVYEFFGMSNSYAAAKMTGIIANILSNNPEFSYNDVLKSLQLQSIHRFWNIFTLKKEQRYPSFKAETKIYKKKYLNELEKMLADFFNLSDSKKLYTYSLYSQKIGGNMLFGHELIKYLETKYYFRFPDYTSISRYDLISIYSVYNLLEEQLKW